ncbi:bloom syndrome [Favolaschia claudopus]|uniref:DNA 3'-5' helicase n=1 Tax=Favolaschia claudopus TaxID=2862362 RepID=A0AAW0BNJ3_9AGAR
MMPLLLHREKYSLVISPLKILQEEQAKHFEKLGLKAAAVNGDTYSRELQKDLDDQTLNAIFTSPEMCLEHESLRKWLQEPASGKRILGTIIDEAHCLSQWGGDFRPHYALLDKLRSILPAESPILAASATMSPSALADLCTSLHVDFDEAFVLNLGNDRPNITLSVAPIKGAKDYDSVFTHLPKPSEVHCPGDLPKTTLFTNAVKKTQILASRIRRHYPNLPKGSIEFLHAYRTPKAKRRVMRDFRKGKIRILVATEAAGMGADIPDIELIIQFGVTTSPEVSVQRFGRAGRDPSLQARAVLLYEISMFQRKKKARRKGDASAATQDNDGSDSDSGTDSEEEGEFDPANASREGIYIRDFVKEPNDGKVWGKNVNPIMRQYISTKHCRRDMLDLYFNNPPRKSPTGECCDNCTRNAASSTSPPSPVSRPTTPQNPSPTSSAHSTPSKDKNANGKRGMTRGEPKTRRKDHLKCAREALERWRLKTFMDRYSKSSLPEVAILPDQVLTSLASKRVNTVEEMLQLRPSWMLARRHGEEVLAMLRRVDEHEREEREREKEAKRTARKEATAARKAAVAATKPRKLPRSRAARRALTTMSPNVSTMSSPITPQNSGAHSTSSNPFHYHYFSTHSNPFPPATPSPSNSSNIAFNSPAPPLYSTYNAQPYLHYASMYNQTRNNSSV